MATAVATDLTRQMYIDGVWCDSRQGQSLAVINPADESVVAEVAYGSTEEAEQAIEAAARAFPAWRALSVYDRAKVLKKTAELMRDRADRIARTLTQEQGKPLGEAKTEVRCQATLCDQASRGSGRHDHSLELSRRPAQPQDRAGLGGRLHGGEPPGRSDAVDPDPHV